MRFAAVIVLAAFADAANLRSLNAIAAGKPSEEYTGAKEYNCYTRELWTEEKTTWCCENEKLGCPRDDEKEEKIEPIEKEEPASFDGYQGIACKMESDMCPMPMCYMPSGKNCKLKPKTLVWDSASQTCCPKTCEFECESPTIEDPSVAFVEAATDSWAEAVTGKNDPRVVTKHFCHDGILWGTRSQQIRVGNEAGGEIERYFDYFAKLPGLEVKKAQYHTARVTDDVYVNNAVVHMREDALPEPFDARMTFIFRHDEDHELNDGWCIFELHSSTFPALSENLKDVSGEKVLDIWNMNGAY